MFVSRSPRSLLGLAMALGLVFLTLLMLSNGERLTASAASQASPGPKIPVRYTVDPFTHGAPSARDVTRGTAVFPGLVEFTVHSARLDTAGGQSQLLVDATLLSMRRSSFVPSQELHLGLADPSGQPIAGLKASAAFDKPLTGGDDRRIGLTGPAPSGPVQLRIWSDDPKNAATFTITPGGTR